MLDVFGTLFKDCPVCGEPVMLMISYNKIVACYELTVGCRNHLNTRLCADAADGLHLGMLAYRWEEAIHMFNRSRDYSQHRLHSARMTTEAAVKIMSEGNPGAMEVLFMMLECYPLFSIEDIILLDKLGVYGSKLYMLWNDCCGRNIDWLYQTMKLFKSGAITAAEIHKNLDQGRATPFIDDPTVKKENEDV